MRGKIPDRQRVRAERQQKTFADGHDEKIPRPGCEGVRIRERPFQRPIAGDGRRELRRRGRVEGETDRSLSARQGVCHVDLQFTCRRTARGPHEIGREIARRSGGSPRPPRPFVRHGEPQVVRPHVHRQRVRLKRPPLRQVRRQRHASRLFQKLVADVARVRTCSADARLYPRRAERNREHAFARFTREEILRAEAPPQHLPLFTRQDNRHVRLLLHGRPRHRGRTAGQTVDFAGLHRDAAAFQRQGPILLSRVDDAVHSVRRRQRDFSVARVRSAVFGETGGHRQSAQQTNHHFIHDRSSTCGSYTGRTMPVKG